MASTLTISASGSDRSVALSSLSVAVSCSLQSGPVIITVDNARPTNPRIANIALVPFHLIAPDQLRSHLARLPTILGAIRPQWLTTSATAQVAGHMEYKADAWDGRAL